MFKFLPRSAARARSVLTVKCVLQCKTFCSSFHILIADSRSNYLAHRTIGDIIILNYAEGTSSIVQWGNVRILLKTEHLYKIVSKLTFISICIIVFVLCFCYKIVGGRMDLEGESAFHFNCC